MTLGHGAAVPGSDCQTLASLGTAGIDDCPTAARLHANQKAMGTCPANLGRLVGTFHFEILGSFEVNQGLWPFFSMPASSCMQN